MAVNTITQQIFDGKALNISNERLHSHEVLAVGNDKLVINFLSRLSDYTYTIQDRIFQITFDEEEYRRYRFRPKTLSNDLYGTIELATSIMRLNGCVSITEFDFSRVKVFDTEFAEALRDILNKEKNYIQENNAKVIEDLKAY
jgi:hypothetical protein